jgi:hypothetical protein
VSPTSKHLLRAALIGCALLAVGAAAPVAFAAPRSTPPCWKRLLIDWYDGTINNIYPIPCYQQAIDHLPADVEAYSSAKDDILAARAAAINHQHAPKEQSPPPSSTTTTITSGGTTTTVTTPVTTTTPDVSAPKKKHGIAGALADITPGDPQAFPLPLLVLGALAILLVIAGGAGMLWQRRHPRDTDVS